MRILHCVSSLQVGGAEKCVKNLVSAQKQQALDIAVMTFGTKDDAFQREIEVLGVPVININGNLLTRTLKLISLIKGYSTLHVHSPAVIRAFSLIFPFLLNKNIVYTIHGEIEPPIGFIKQSHWLAKYYVDKVFGVSENIKAGINKRYGWSSTSVEVIKNGVAIPEAFELIGDNPKLQLCTVSRLVPLKNISQLINAFERFQCNKYADLHIYGDGPEMLALNSLAMASTIKESIVFHGAVLNEDEIYREKDLLLINSTTEGLPMALLEAMARGIPSFSTSVGEIPNVISNLDNGVVYSVNDLEYWHSQIIVIQENRQRLKAMGVAARQFVKDHFAIDHISALYKKKSYQ